MTCASTAAHMYTAGANGGQESASATSESAFGASSRGHGDAVSEGAQGAYINPAVSRSGAVANTGAIGGPGEPPAQQSQHSVSHAGLNGNAAGTSGQLAEFGIPENSAVLAPIALQEDEPVRIPLLVLTLGACRCYVFTVVNRYCACVAHSVVHSGTT